MELFDKKFVYLEWDDVLEGKEVFIADTLPQLRLLIGGNCDSLQEVSKNVDEDSFWPFVAPCGTKYAMVYYDPNYDCKLAYTQGKQIQSKTKLLSDPWTDCIGEPFWSDTCEYRVKPAVKLEEQAEPKKKRRMTNRELAQWVAQGNGQVRHRDGNFAFNIYEAYDVRNDDEPCPFYWLVRGWDETEWHMPEIEE